MPVTVVTFGEWAPDQPELSPEVLTEAHNVIPYSDYYIPFNPLSPIFFDGGTLPALARGALLPFDSGGTLLYAGTATQLFMSDSSGTMVARSATLTSVGTFNWEFTQFDNLVFAVQNNVDPRYHTLRSASNFATFTAPRANHIGVIGRFLVIGNLVDTDGTALPSRIRWSAIDDPTNFPTPNSATATATQAGEQEMDTQYGAVRKIIPGDQYGIVFQEKAITRVTYVGPPVVFQFDIIDNIHGLQYPTDAVKAGALTYLRARDGLYKTDGVSVVPIGMGKVDKTFLAGVSSGPIPQAGFDNQKQCVFWTYESGATNTAASILYMNINSGRFSKASENTTCVIAGLDRNFNQAAAFDANNIASVFSATPGNSTITTGEAELIPGSYSRVSGVRALVNDATTSSASVTVSIGYRSDQITEPTFTSGVTATARTGFSDFRVEARYHRAKVVITGGFTKAFGIAVNAVGSGET